MYLGGKLWYDASPEGAGRLRYDSGRTQRSPNINGQDVWIRFNNTKVFMCQQGVRFRNRLPCSSIPLTDNFIL
jgi:hypothetical protein